MKRPGAKELVAAARDLREAVEGMHFSPPVAMAYNPLVYAWEPHRRYLERWGGGTKRVLFLGMNPGPWGMAQVGVPFGEIGLVRDWIGIEGRVEQPERTHPKRPIKGFACARSEVSGRRLWGYFAERFGSAEAFFQDHFVTNYCPLMLLSEDGKNVTPDKLRAGDRDSLFTPCDAHLKRMVEILSPQWVIGVGRFAADRAAAVLAELPVQTGAILHPSPASPAANRGWAEAAEKQLTQLGVSGAPPT